MLKTKYLSIILLALLSGLTYAAQTTTTAPAPLVVTPSAANASTPVVQQPSALSVQSPALVNADKNADALNDAKAKLAIKKVQDQINQAAVGGNKSAGVSQLGQTTATNVILNQQGYKSATLQFIDGSTLDVIPGSRIGKYVVDNITMTGVTLSDSNCRGSHCSKLIKRAYPNSTPTRSSGSNLSNGNPYQPTPVINNQSSQMVPPLVSH